jgi:ABC-type lipoprotein export system ATPase subunit
VNILVRDLFYIYKNNGESIVALRGLNLEARTGECLVIKGPNGSGKSTLVKLLTGYYVPTAGEIIVDGQDTSTLDTAKLRREVIASLDQRGNLVKELSVLENLELAYSLSGLSGIKESAISLLEEHALIEVAEKYPAELSAGQRQFISLLAALATKPKVLIADEPTGELDDAAAAVIYEALKEVSASTIVILVTHDARSDKYADRIVRIREGRISEAWKPGESEESVVDSFGWMRVQEIAHEVPTRLNRILGKEPIFRVENLALSYGERLVFSNLSFTGRPGELIVLDSSKSPGSGKSSLLRILAGIQDAKAGEVKVLDATLSTLDRSERALLRRDSISYLGQRESSVEHLSLGDFLDTTSVDLGEALNVRKKSAISTFSGGERARIELTKIIAEARPILLLDEPTSQMDERKIAEVIGLLYRYLSAGGLAIVITRNEYLIEAADQVIGLT